MSHPTIEDLIQELGDICHQHYLGCFSNKEAPDGYEYNYDTEVIAMLESPEARKYLQERESRIIAEAKIEELKKWLSMVSWPNNYRAMRTDMEERIKQLEGKD